MKDKGYLTVDTFLSDAIWGLAHFLLEGQINVLDFAQLSVSAPQHFSCIAKAVRHNERV